MRHQLTFTFLAFLCFALFIPEGYTQCYPDRHNTSMNTSWLSCTKKVSPNPDRSSGHWIRYDLGAQYTIGSLTLWNFNHPDHLNDGARTIALEYRNGGSEWLSAGTIDIRKGQGSSYYEGQYVELDGEITADELLMTLIDNYGGDCSGFAEVRFDLKGMTTSAEDVDNDHFDIKISPNPFSDFASIEVLDLEGGYMDYQVINSLGQVMISDRTVVTSGQSRFVLNTAGFPSGNYFLKVIDGRKVSVEKLAHQIK